MTDSRFLEDLEKEETLFKRFSMVGHDNVRVSGSLDRGFAVNLEGEGEGGGEEPPPTETGACCLDGDCYETNQFACVSAGGTYQGNGTLCSSVTVNCTETTSGACCVGENCSIETPEHCAEIGGTYQGDNTTCDPNPCDDTIPCGCGFTAFEGFGGDPNIRYLIKTYTFTRTASSSAGHPTCDVTENYTTVKIWDILSDPCVMNTTCDGSVTMHEEGEDECNEPWVNSGTHEHDDTAGFAGGCHESPPGCHACVPLGCDTCTLIPTSATTAQCDCTFTGIGQLANLTITATLSDPRTCV